MVTVLIAVSVRPSGVISEAANLRLPWPKAQRTTGGLTRTCVRSGDEAKAARGGHCTCARLHVSRRSSGSGERTQRIDKNHAWDGERG